MNNQIPNKLLNVFFFFPSFPSAGGGGFTGGTITGLVGGLINVGVKGALTGSTFGSVLTGFTAGGCPKKFLKSTPLD